MPANQNIFQCQHDRMPHMQLTRGIGRRHGDGEAGLIGLSVRSEPTTFPLLIEIGFKFGVIRLGRDVMAI